MRLIDLDSVGVGKRTASVFLRPESAAGWNELLSLLEKQEPIDPVRVSGGVYCKECKFYEGHGVCKNVIGMLTANKDGFCSNGEMKEETKC